MDFLIERGRLFQILRTNLAFLESSRSLSNLQTNATSETGVTILKGKRNLSNTVISLGFGLAINF